MTQQTIQRPGRNLGDQIAYFRRSPDAEENPGWITWGDTTSGTKLRDFQIRGFTWLSKYGYINSRANEKLIEDRVELGEHVTEAERIWGPILRHPDGPAEFPVDQILTLRWYKPEHCPVAGVVFPQLKGTKIKEYRCPECRRNPFVDAGGVTGAVVHLATHLRIMHGWDRTALNAYGERVGINFNSPDVAEAFVQEFTVGGEADKEEEEGLLCKDCGQMFAGKMAKARLTKHEKTHDVQVETV